MIYIYDTRKRMIGPTPFVSENVREFIRKHYDDFSPLGDNEDGPIGFLDLENNIVNMYVDIDGSNYHGELKLPMDGINSADGTLLKPETMCQMLNHVRETVLDSFDDMYGLC